MRTGRQSDVKVGTRISVFWDLDKKWYDAEVLDCDPATGTCKVLYTDGEREEFELKQVKHRILWNGNLRERDKWADELVSSRKQLEYIVKTLLDMEDRLPPRGVLNNRKKWWQVWHSRVTSAGKSGNLRELVKGTIEIAFQMKDSVSTSWWKSQKLDWQKEVLLTRTNRELASHVSELLTKAVDWAVARQLFSWNVSENDYSNSVAVDLQEDTDKVLVDAPRSGDQGEKLSESHQFFASGSIPAAERLHSSKCRTRKQGMGKEKKSSRLSRVRPADTGGMKDIQSFAVHAARRSKRKLVEDDGTELASVNSPTDNAYRADQIAGLGMSSAKRRREENSDGLRALEPIPLQVERISMPNASQKDLRSTDGFHAKTSRQKGYSVKSVENGKESSRKDETIHEIAAKRSKPCKGTDYRGVAQDFGWSGDGFESIGLETDEKQVEVISGMRKSERKRTRLGSRLEGSCELKKEEENVVDKVCLDSRLVQESLLLNAPVLEKASSHSRFRRTRKCALKSGLEFEDTKVLKEGDITNVHEKTLGTEVRMLGTICSSSSADSSPEDDSGEDYQVEDISEYLRHEDSWGGKLLHETSDFKGENVSSQLREGPAYKDPTIELPSRSQSLVTGEERCSICEFAGADESMLLCDEDGCNCALHTFCLDPPMQSIPEGEWLCPHCTDEKANTSGSRRRTTKRCSGDKYPAKEIGSIIGRRKAFLSDEGKSSGISVMQYLVKWDLLSHQHDTWVPEDWLLFKENRMVVGFRRKYPLSHQNADLSFDERRPEWLLVDRVISCRCQGTNVYPQQLALYLSDEQLRKQLKFLVKWRALDYKSATWEKEMESEEIRKAISEYIERHERADTIETRGGEGMLTAASIMQQPAYLQGGMMFSFQYHGLKWLLTNFQQGRSVILADEMGLGKTMQAVAFIACVRHERLSSSPALVIVPKSTLPGWEQEFKRWTPGLNTVIYQGDKENRARIREHEFYTKSKKPLFDVLLTSYELATCDDFLLRRFHWASLLVDEGHRVKNIRSKLGILLKRHASDFRLLLTSDQGTPVQNTLKELLALLHFLDPMEFPDPENSVKDFMEVDIHGNASTGAEGVQQQVSRIHDVLRPRMLRRLKSEVLNDMIPGKKLVEVSCALTPLQRHLYVAILKRNYRVLNKGVKSGFKRAFFTLLTDLKMVCNHPYLFPGKEPQHLEPVEAFKMLVLASGKLQLLEKLLPRLKDGGHRVLLFSQMTKMLDILEDFLVSLGLSYARIDGSTPAGDRGKYVAEFNSANSTTFVFLISTRAGGLGINLPSADTVIIYDPDFNPFVDIQAQARAHRIGQDKTVLVYQLFTKFSVEEKILQRSRKKLAMENLVMSPGSKDTGADINALLLHGAKQLLKDYEIEASSINFSDEDVDKLLNRDISISAVSNVEPQTQGYLGAVEECEFLHPSADEHEDLNSTGWDESEWQGLLQNLAEQDEKELGRGKRIRKHVTYTVEAHAEVHEDDEYGPTSDGGNSSSSDVCLISEVVKQAEQAAEMSIGNLSSQPLVTVPTSADIRGNPDEHCVREAGLPSRLTSDLDPNQAVSHKLFAGMSPRTINFDLNIDSHYTQPEGPPVGSPFLPFKPHPLASQPFSLQCSFTHGLVDPSNAYTMKVPCAFSSLQRAIQGWRKTFENKKVSRESVTQDGGSGGLVSRGKGYDSWHVCQASKIQGLLCSQALTSLSSQIQQGTVASCKFNSNPIKAEEFSKSSNLPTAATAPLLAGYHAVPSTLHSSEVDVQKDGACEDFSHKISRSAAEALVSHLNTTSFPVVSGCQPIPSVAPYPVYAPTTSEYFNPTVPLSCPLSSDFVSCRNLPTPVASSTLREPKGSQVLESTQVNCMASLLTPSDMVNSCPPQFQPPSWEGVRHAKKDTDCMISGGKVPSKKGVEGALSNFPRRKKCSRKISPSASPMQKECSSSIVEKVLGFPVIETRDRTSAKVLLGDDSSSEFSRDNSQVMLDISGDRVGQHGVCKDSTNGSTLKPQLQSRKPLWVPKGDAGFLMGCLQEHAGTSTTSIKVENGSTPQSSLQLSALSHVRQMK